MITTLPQQILENVSNLPNEMQPVGCNAIAPF